MIPIPAKLTKLQLFLITKAIPNPSIKQFIKYLVKNPNSTSANIIGQTGINDIMEAIQLASKPLFNKGYFLWYQATGSRSSPTEKWRIAKIPDHANHCNTAEELSVYLSQLGNLLDAYQDLRGEA